MPKQMGASLKFQVREITRGSDKRVLPYETTRIALTAKDKIRQEKGVAAGVFKNGNGGNRAPPSSKVRVKTTRTINRKPK